MTTIAWDGKTMAADTMGCQAGYLRIKSKKLAHFGEYVYGNTGAASNKYIVGLWLENGAKMNDRPELEEDGGCGLVVHKPTRKLYVVEGKRVVLLELYEPFWASGSGRDFAIAAMALGKSAIQAVELAIRFDVGSGGEVEAIDVYASDQPSNLWSNPKAIEENEEYERIKRSLDALNITPAQFEERRKAAAERVKAFKTRNNQEDDK